MLPGSANLASQSSAKTVLGLVYGGDTFPTDEVTYGSAICSDAIKILQFGTAGSTLPMLVFIAMFDHLNNCKNS